MTTDFFPFVFTSIHSKRTCTTYCHIIMIITNIGRQCVRNCNENFIEIILLDDRFPNAAIPAAGGCVVSSVLSISTLKKEREKI